MMDDIFKDEKAQGWVIIYMNDIFIFTKELLDNISNTRKILQKLWDNDLYLKSEKCSFWQTKVEYLGLIIEEGKIGMDPTKLKGIANWPEPTTVKHSISQSPTLSTGVHQSPANVRRTMTRLLLSFV